MILVVKRCSEADRELICILIGEAVEMTAGKIEMEFRDLEQLEAVCYLLDMLNYRLSQTEKYVYAFAPVPALPLS